MPFQVLPGAFARLNSGYTAFLKLPPVPTGSKRPKHTCNILNMAPMALLKHGDPIALATNGDTVTVTAMAVTSGGLFQLPTRQLASAKNAWPRMASMAPAWHSGVVHKKSLQGILVARKSAEKEPTASMWRREKGMPAMRMPRMPWPAARWRLHPGLIEANRRSRRGQQRRRGASGGFGRPPSRGNPRIQGLPRPPSATDTSL